MAKFQLRWGTAAVISMTKPGHALLLTARCIPSLMQQLFSVYLHASTNALHHPNWHGTKQNRGLCKTQLNDVQGNIPVIPIICHSHVNSLGGGCFLTMRICSLVSGNYHLSSMWVIITGHGSISSPKMKCQNRCDSLPSERQSKEL